MKISSLPLLRMSPPGAVISVNFCMRLGCDVGGCWAARACSGCAEGGGTMAGPARRAGEGAVVARMAGCCVDVTGGATVPGDCTGVPTLPAFVRAIVFGACTVPGAPLGLTC